MGEPLDLRLRLSEAFRETERVETFISISNKFRLVLTGEGRDEYLNASQDVWRRPIDGRWLHAQTGFKPLQSNTFYSRIYSNEMFGILATAALQGKVGKTFLGLEVGAVQFHDPDGSTDNRPYAGLRLDF